MTAQTVDNLDENRVLSTVFFILNLGVSLSAGRRHQWIRFCGVSTIPAPSRPPLQSTV